MDRGGWIGWMGTNFFDLIRLIPIMKLKKRKSFLIPFQLCAFIKFRINLAVACIAH